MGMASFTSNQDQIEEEFISLQQYYDQHQSQQQWDILSMGMSGDYPLALTCGSNMIRLVAVYSEQEINAYVRCS